MLARAGEARASPPRVVVEVDARTSSALDERSTRRLITLEVGEIDVPPMPSASIKLREAILYFRVVETTEGAARIELWERGSYYGARTISTARGSPRLWPRRIALAAAELARRLKQRRIAEAERIAAEQRRKEALEEVARSTPPFARTAFAVGVDGAATTRGGAWMIGPRLATEVRFGSGFRLSGAGSWRFGQVGGLSQAPPLQWIELEAAPGYAFALHPRFDLVLDVPLAAAVVRFGEGASTDGITAHQESWSARAGVSVRGEAKFGKFRLGVGPNAGILLHPLRVVDDGRSTVIGGSWLGATLSLVLDPNARP